MGTETGHFERQFVGEEKWEVVTKDYLLSHGGSMESINVMIDNPLTEVKINPFAYYRWVEEGG
jgi:hypothetical protein